MHVMADVIDFFNMGVGLVNDKLSYILIAVLLFAGTYLTLSLGFIQIRHLSHMFGVLHNSREKDHAGISSYQAFCTSMASRVGVGNIAGIAVAIVAGGPGAIFWMWVIAFLGAATAFAESTLAQVFKQKDIYGHFRGGPAYYMERGLNARWMGVLFSIFLIMCYGFVFNAVHANTVAQIVHSTLHIPVWYIGVFTMFLAFIVILGGIRRIARFSECFVPLKAGLYVLLAVVIIIMNYSRVPDVIALVCCNAFGFQEAAAGGIGVAIMNGIKRGLFSNEAGMGSAPNIAAAATPYPPHPASQGYVQMAGVIIDTVIICTASAAIILLSGVPLDSSDGVLLVQYALESQYGSWSKYFLTVIIMLFGFTSIVGNYSYAENCFFFLCRRTVNRLYIFRIAVCVMVLFGAIASLPLVWAMADIAMACMAITNLAAVLLLSRLVVKLARDYNKQLREKRLPTFDIKHYPEVQNNIAEGVWGKE